MKDAFRTLPSPLQRQIMSRLAIGIGFLFVTILFVIAKTPFLVVVPGIVVSLFCGISGISLFFLAISGDYIVLHGKCTDIFRSPVKKRVTSILLQTDEHVVQIRLNRSTHKFTVGVIMDVYLNKHTPVYVKDGIKIIYQYITLDVKGEKKHVS